nr:AzlC family ABC transporter permease [Halobellus rufus]
MSQKPDDRPTGSSDRIEPVSFSLAGLRTGFLRCTPIALGVAGYGVVFGILADRAGLSAAEATLMSATVLAGAAQLVAVEVWAEPIPVLAVVGTTLVVNLRYLLMGAALRPWFEDLTPLQAYGSAFFTADENWALTIGELRSGSDGARSCSGAASPSGCSGSSPRSSASPSGASSSGPRGSVWTSSSPRCFSSSRPNSGRAGLLSPRGPSPP